jgi:hypothetical protein
MGVTESSKRLKGISIKKIRQTIMFILEKKENKQKIANKLKDSKTHTEPIVMHKLACQSNDSHLFSTHLETISM